MSSASSLPSTQKAWLWTAVGKPLEWTTSFPVAQPTAGRVAIRVHATTLNAIDFKVQSFGNWFSAPLPTPTGYDYSGVIVALGDGVTNFKVGDEVFGHSFLSDPGTFAEYTTVAVELVAKKPASVSHIEAAGLGGVAGLSAYQNFVAIDVKGKTVFVAGGSGGVGSYAVQIAKARGAAKVFTSASKDEAIEWLQTNVKPDAIVNYKKENVVEAIKKLTNGEGVDVAYDSTYEKSSLLQSIEVLKTGGVVVVLDGAASPPEDIAKLLAAKNATASYSDLGSYSTSLKKQASKVGEFSKELGELAAAGKLKSYITETLTLEGVSDGLEKLKANKTKGGKIVVKHV